MGEVKNFAEEKVQFNILMLVILKVLVPIRKILILTKGEFKIVRSEIWLEAAA